MATINYNGMELEEFISSEPKIFNPPARMAVWDGSYNVVVEDDVYVYDPRRKDSYCVITATASWLHCALLPDHPKPRRATNRELARWLAQGNGEWKLEGPISEEDQCSSDYVYFEKNESYKLDCDILVRKWSDTEWHEPTVDYLGLEDL